MNVAYNVGDLVVLPKYPFRKITVVEGGMSKDERATQIDAWENMVGVIVHVYENNSSVVMLCGEKYFIHITSSYIRKLM